MYLLTDGKLKNERGCVNLGSTDYQAAVRETKALFHDGLCCESNQDLAAEQVPTTCRNLCRCNNLSGDVLSFNTFADSKAGFYNF